jgi:hypothetical protein
MAGEGGTFELGRGERAEIAPSGARGSGGAADRVEADEYGVEPTLIELPRWLDEG